GCAPAAAILAAAIVACLLNPGTGLAMPLLSFSLVRGIPNVVMREGTGVPMHKSLCLGGAGYMYWCRSCSPC
ncbi:MAG: hypothetical protein AAGK77_13150, partial [Pseudomonadota bacterium]